jgi:AhpC/TSA family
MKKISVFLWVIMPYVAFSQMDSLKFFVQPLNDSTYHIGASYSDDFFGTRAIEFKTRDKIEIDSLKRGLVPYRFKAHLNHDFGFLNMKVQKRKRDSILKIMVNAPIADFDAPDTEGFVHRPKNYHGRVLILHFWNFWDSSFDFEIPFFNKLLDKYSKDGLAVLSFTDIGVGDSEKEYMKKHPANFTIIPNSRSFDSKIFPMTHSIPCLMVVDKQGLMRYFYIDHELGNLKGNFYKDADETRSFEAQIISLLRGQ